MKFISKRIFFLFVALLLIIILFFTINDLIKSGKFRESKYSKIVPNFNKVPLKKTIFKSKVLERDIAKLEKTLDLQKKQFTKISDKIRKYYVNQIKKGIIFEYKESSDYNFDNLDFRIDFYKTNDLFYPKNRVANATAYLEFYDNNIFLIDPTGNFFYMNRDDFVSKNIIKKKFRNISSNINEIVTDRNFFHESLYGVKDVYIDEDKMYISFSNELTKDCYNMKILVAKLDLKILKFEEFFNPNKCVKKENEYGEFHAYHSGGRIYALDENQLVFTNGEFRFRDHAQNPDNYFGKILLINKHDMTTKVLSMGHRNPQGLYVDKENKIIFATEHGPKGGDEVNIIKFSQIDKKLNFGWPISSYGNHYYKTTIPELKKSHKDYGFIEPAIYFTPSIGISEIISIDQFVNNTNKNVVPLLLGSLGYSNRKEGQSIYFLNYLKNTETINLIKSFRINRRIRDIVKTDNEVLLFFENTSEIGSLKFN